jgi:hypothetical protein
MKKLKTEPITIDENHQDTRFNVYKSSSEYISMCKESIPNFNLSEDQDNVLKYWGEHLDNLKVHKQNKLYSCLLGGPGNGKTYVINRFRHMIKTAGFKSSVAAFMGVAAGLHEGGETICTKFAMKQPKKDSKRNTSFKGFCGHKQMQLIEKLRNDWENLDYLFIDEISIIDAITMGLISQTLSFILNNAAPFGGLNVIIAGDFFQLPPINGKSLYTDTLIYNKIIQPQENDKDLENPTLPRTLGIQLFSNFTLKCLTQNRRAENDTDHIQRIDKLRDMSKDGGVCNKLIDYLKTLQLNYNEMENWLNSSTIVLAHIKIENLMFLIAKNFAKCNRYNQ